VAKHCFIVSSGEQPIAHLISRCGPRENYTDGQEVLARTNRLQICVRLIRQVDKMWRVMPLKTPFRLLIRLITTSLVVTTFNYYTVTHLHSLQFLHANIPFYLFGASGIHLENFEILTADC
jgi:hypothetical protein